MSYNLWIDDQANDPDCPARHCPNGTTWKVATSSAEAIAIVKEFDLPDFVDFDHDLGHDDSVMNFLRWLEHSGWASEQIQPFDYKIHSANPVGSKNIESFMDSWWKVYEDFNSSSSALQELRSSGES